MFSPWSARARKSLNGNSDAATGSMVSPAALNPRLGSVNSGEPMPGSSATWRSGVPIWKPSEMRVGEPALLPTPLAVLGESLTLSGSTAPGYTGPCAQRVGETLARAHGSQSAAPVSGRTTVSTR
eukprot:Amastigsp_a676669_8.p4 type:complete len:125 gc:universal Amastigsp_a676669_8:488-114(-)